MSLIGASSNASLFSQLAFPQAQLMTAADAIPPFALPMLLTGYDQVVGQSPLASNATIPPFLTMPSPAQMMGVMQPIAGAGYAQPGGVSRYSQGDWLRGFMNPETRGAAQMERVLRGDPFARSAFEQAIGGRIVDFGTNDDGRMAVQRSAANPYAQALGGGALSPIASQLGGLYQQMNEGVVSNPLVNGIGRSPFMPLALNGFASMANQLMSPAFAAPAALAGAGANPAALMGAAVNPAALMGAGVNPAALMGAGVNPAALAAMAPNNFAGFNGGVQGMPLFGQGQASWNPLAAPGKINNGNAGAEGAHSAQVNSILSDPSLTMEDKIMLSLMVICQKMDDDIKRQSEYLNKLQNQQGGKKGGKSGEKSIDIETKKLERMIQKRSQLFDTLGKIMERYDQSAKNVIQSMRS